MKYAYEDLSPEQFETLVVFLCQQLLGISVQGFSKGPDGGRDAKFVGTAELHPSKSAPWTGTVIVQAKHTNGVNRTFSDADFFSSTAGDTVIGKEVPRIKNLKAKSAIDHYMLFSNRRLAGNADETIRGHISKECGLPIGSLYLCGIEQLEVQTQIEDDVEKQNSDGTSLFSSIRVFFSEIVEDVIDRKALLSVASNQQGHLEFRAEILDESGNATSANLGHTYRKLLCVAFDMAVLRAHLEKKAPRFVYHDGVFESLDDRKKVNLLAVMREYANFGLQFVITLIDSELPARAEGDEPMFADEEIVLRLHDEGPDGRLFKMAAW